MNRENDVEITPEYAQDLLNANDNNRNLPRANLDRYVADMKRGSWFNIGDPIRIGKTGRLLDGQTRLSAVVASGIPQRFDVIRDMDENLQVFMDTGKPRSANDVFNMHGITNVSIAVGMIRFVMHLDAGTILTSGKAQIPNQELLKFAETNGNLVYESCKRGSEVREKLTLPPTIPAAVYYQARQVANVFDVNYFFERLADGLMLTPGNPIVAFRDFVIRRAGNREFRTRRIEYLWYLMHVWNVWAGGESISKLQQPKGGLYRSDQFKPLRLVLPGVVPEGAKDEYYKPNLGNQVIKQGGGSA